MKTKKLTHSKAKLQAWKAFSLYIRRRYADSEGYSSCVTCGARKPYIELQAGHFIGGRHTSILFNEFNCHQQCAGCNVFGRGMTSRYYDFMLKMYGQEIINELMEKDRQIVKYKVADLLEIEEKYKNLLKELVPSEL